LEFRKPPCTRIVVIFPARENPASTLIAVVKQDCTGPLIALSGESDSSTAVQLSQLIDDQLAGGTSCLTIDASKLTFADSASVRVFALAARTLRRRGGALIVLQPQRALTRVLQIMGTDQLITIRETGEGPR
jgi:anti-anti-sigma factor